MAQEEKENKQAVSGTEQKKEAGMPAIGESGCPTWDSLGGNGGGDMLPFFSPREELKREGFKVRFLSNGPRRETQNRFKEDARDLWFDIEHLGETYTWTISQISLLVELKRHEPLAGKEFEITLVPVDEEFKKDRPNYKGKDRYQVELVSESGSLSRASPPAAEAGSGPLPNVVVEEVVEG